MYEENEEESQEERDQKDEQEEHKLLKDSETKNEVREEESDEEEKREKLLRKSMRQRKQPQRYTDHAFLTYQEAITGSDRYEWAKAIDEEKKSLQENNTWYEIDIEEVKNKKLLRSKWVFKIKQDERYKLD